MTTFATLFVLVGIVIPKEGFDVMSEIIHIFNNQYECQLAVEVITQQMKLETGTSTNYAFTCIRSIIDSY